MYSCSACSSENERKSHYDTHARTHTGERPFVACEMCGYSCSRADDLTRHMRTHTGAKPFACEECPATFSEADSLKKHMRTHTGEKPFACDACPATFSRVDNLKAHMRTHTGEKPFVCSICPSAFAQAGTLSRHMMTHSRYAPCDVHTAGFVYIYEKGVSARACMDAWICVSGFTSIEISSNDCTVEACAVIMLVTWCRLSSLWLIHFVVTIIELCIHGCLYLRES